MNERDIGLSKILSSINDCCFFALDADGYFTEFNQQAAAWFGADPARLLQAHYHDIFSGREHAPAIEAIQAAMANGQASIAEQRSGRRPDRRTEWRFQPLNGGLNVFLRDTSVRKRAGSKSERSCTQLQTAMDAISSHVAILDARGDIIAVNLPWQKFDRDHGCAGEHCGVGRNYLSACEAAGVACNSMEKIAAGLRAVLHCDTAEFSTDYDCCRGGRANRLRIRITRHSMDSATYLLVVRESITVGRQPDRKPHHLAGQLLAVQDAAQRRVARELHDTTAQNLLCATMALQRASSLMQTATDEVRACLAEAAALIAASQSEIRTLAYLLHPPMLDEAGLPAALRWFVSGLVRRTGLDITLEIDPGFESGQLSLEIGTALFRVAQEALINVHRHSGSAAARITLRLVGPGLRRARLEVADAGCGLPPGGEVWRAGVGLMGMSERVQQIGGDIAFRRGEGAGTIVIATVPLGGSSSAIDASSRKIA